MTTRRFPPPCTAEVTPNCFIVRDADGQQLAYVYFEDEPGRRSAAKLSLGRASAEMMREERAASGGSVAKLSALNPNHPW